MDGDIPAEILPFLQIPNMDLNSTYRNPNQSIPSPIDKLRENKKDDTTSNNNNQNLLYISIKSDATGQYKTLKRHRHFRIYLISNETSYNIRDRLSHHVLNCLNIINCGSRKGAIKEAIEKCIVKHEQEAMHLQKMEINLDILNQLKFKIKNGK